MRTMTTAMANTSRAVSITITTTRAGSRPRICGMQSDADLCALIRSHEQLRALLEEALSMAESGMIYSTISRQKEIRAELEKIPRG